MATARMALKKTKEETLGIDKIYLKKGHLTDYNAPGGGRAGSLQSASEHEQTQVTDTKPVLHQSKRPLIK
jgi:hypothetical protein